jgi:5-methylcytosine-specific restriction enzyme subunit McrC
MAEADIAAEGKIPIRNLWHMLLYVWDARRLKDRWRTQVEDAPSLDALLSSVLAGLLQQRLRIGLDRRYREEESLLAGIRGRIRFRESLKRLTFPHGRAVCRYEAFRANVPMNQIIKSTLARTIQVGSFGPDRARAEELRANLRRLVRTLEGIDVIELKADGIRRQRLGRHDADYAAMLSICQLLLDRQQPTERQGTGMLPGLDRDAMTLAKIYERFVAKFYLFHLHDSWDIRPQSKIEWPADTPSPHLPVMFPDLSMQHKESGRLLVLDTKFTPHLLVPGQWKNLTFDRSHLFQMYAYLRSQENQPPHHETATGLLLYPTVFHHVEETISIQGHDIGWMTINLNQPWETIEADLLQIPQTVLSGNGSG